MNAPFGCFVGTTPKWRARTGPGLLGALAPKISEEISQVPSPACRYRARSRGIGRHAVPMDGGSPKPWWRQLWGVPPWMQRSGKAPLTDLDVWTWRLGIPALLGIAALLWVAFGSPIPLIS